MEQVPDLSGHIIGNWRLMRRLGVGSFGAVYEACNTSIDKQAALKILLPQWAINPAIVARFLREASAASRTRHPSVVEFYDGGTAPDGLCYIVMELCSGPPLSQILKAAALGPARTTRLGSQLADALEAVHAQKVVHRDLKPDNIILVPDKREGEIPKILDFGIAKLRAVPSQTIDGQLLGTPAYMSPEQCRSEADIDHRADIYALGVVLFECLTGSLPFRAEHYLGYLTAHTTQVPPDPRSLRGDVPEGLAVLLLRMLAKERDARPASMAEVRDTLEALRAEVVQSSLGTTAPPLLRRPAHAPTLALTSPGLSASPVGTIPPPTAGWLRPLLLFGVLGVLLLGAVGAVARLRAPSNAPIAPRPEPALLRNDVAQQQNAHERAARDEAKRMQAAARAASEQADKEQAERAQAAREQAQQKEGAQAIGKQAATVETAKSKRPAQDKAARVAKDRPARSSKSRPAHERAAEERMPAPTPEAPPQTKTKVHLF